MTFPIITVLLTLTVTVLALIPTILDKGSDY
jgi:hypothetical protein